MLKIISWFPQFDSEISRDKTYNETMEALKQACKVQTFKSNENIVPGEYRVQEFAFVETKFGRKIKVETETFYCFFPTRFLVFITSEHMNSNPHVDDDLSMMMMRWSNQRLNKTAKSLKKQSTHMAAHSWFMCRRRNCSWEERREEKEKKRRENKYTENAR